MKAIALTLEFHSLAELHGAVSRLRGAVEQTTVITYPVKEPEDAEIVGEPQQGEQLKRPRKPRSDAGQPRGTYKTTGEPAASEPGQAVNSVAAAPATPATPTHNAAPPASRSGATVGESATAPAGAAPTFEDARAALKRISSEKGMGTEACMVHLNQFGVVQITKLPEAMYAVFIKQADEKIAEHRKAAK
jgi:hypothetical protein